MIIAPDLPLQEDPNEELKVAVSKVFDGDGFLANVWNPVRKAWVNRLPFRFAFIDAPELQQPFGAESRDFLSSLILRKTLRLDLIGKESMGYLPVDSYKRMLCMAYVTERMEIGRIEYFLGGKCAAGSVKRARPVTRNIEIEMIVNGFAWVTPQYAFEREAEYFEAQENARQNQRGLWALEDPEPPWKFKRRQKRSNRPSNGQGRLL